MSISSQRLIGEGLTFDDVLMVPAYSEVLPKDVATTSKFSRNIDLNIPIVSAAMDTVTESAMAIALAREGGIGVVHKNMSIEEQALHVRKVKRADNGMIYDPITVTADLTVGDVLDIMKENKIGGIPVVDKHGLLEGIVTNRDLRFQEVMDKEIMEVMTSKNIITAGQDINLEKAASILERYKIEKLPVVDKDNVLVGLITYKDIFKAKDRPNSCKDEQGRLRVAAAVGISKGTEARIAALVDASVDAIVIDTAHGHTKSVAQLVNKVKKAYKGIDVVVGNIATPEAALMLADNGADAVKVGIGPGSICTTRVIAGVGMPQLSAVYDVASVMNPKGIPVIADGGLRFSGDIVKAIAGGASSVMTGSLFAGTEESPGETIIYNGRKFKSYRGMGSIEAMQKGSKDRYFQAEETDSSKLVAEGIAARVPYKGTISEVVYQLVGGLKAGMGYCGTPDIEFLQRNGKFVKITNSGMLESHPHDVVITREAPNYSREF
ncbi:MAG: IMP dehydrogenase [Bacteroidota bacterium]|nr:IMP dehydrogenase [Bacteroidota bacterium]